MPRFPGLDYGLGPSIAMNRNAGLCDSHADCVPNTLE
ncbi:uncharacterized protein METZ01_LOCUS121336, partial [marine metagenome]